MVELRKTLDSSAPENTGIELSLVLWYKESLGDMKGKLKTARIQERDFSQVRLLFSCESPLPYSTYSPSQSVGHPPSFNPLIRLIGACRVPNFMCQGIAVAYMSSTPI